MDLLERKIADYITPSLEDMGYRIVRVKLFDADISTLQIMAERVSDKDLNVDDCEKISREISAILDVEDPISGEYNLEVSSPGIDRPLVSFSDFTDYANNVAKITTNLPIDGRKRFKGLLLGTNDDKDIIIKLDDNQQEAVIAFNDIASAKLVITDELLKKQQQN